MTTIEESIEIEVPVSTAYNQWTQFETFPQFMDGIERVEQKDDKHLHWTAEIGGDKREWDAEITEAASRPSSRMASDRSGRSERRRHLPQARRGTHQGHGADGIRARRRVQESIGSFVGMDSRRVKGDLESFKEFIEGRAHETGAWRGNIDEK